MKPYYQDEAVTIYHADCREILGDMPHVDLLLTDPPYGMKCNTTRTRFTPGPNCNSTGGGKDWGVPIVGDDAPFDPSPWLAYQHVILWGANHYAQRLPVGTTLVFIKRLDPAFGTFLSDAEIGWVNSGKGVYCFRDANNRQSRRIHPSQKPVALMAWCIGFAKGAQTLLDPFMGSGTTLRAAKDCGLKHAIGIEIEERYCEIAAKRMAQEVLAFEATG